MNLSYFDLCRSAPALSGGGTLCMSICRRKKGKGKRKKYTTARISSIQRRGFLPPLGGWRGGKKDRTVFQGEWVGCWGLMQESQRENTHRACSFLNIEPCDKLRAKDTISDTLRLTKLPVGQFGIFFLRRLTRRILQAKPKNTPSVPPFGRLRLLREGVAGERKAGERENKKRDHRW